MGRDLDIGVPTGMPYHRLVEIVEGIPPLLNETKELNNNVEEVTTEIARARRASELILGQEVEESD